MASVSLPTIGLTLGIATVSYDPNGGVVSARAFETDGLDDNPAGPGSVVVEDDDLQFRGEDNSFGGEADGGGECAGCAGLGRLLVIPDYRAYVPWGDHIFGGDHDFASVCPSSKIIGNDTGTWSVGARAHAKSCGTASGKR